MEVFIVTSGDYSDYHIVAVFSTAEKAQAYIDIELGNEGTIEPFKLDERQDHVKQHVWCVSIHRNGEVQRNNDYDTVERPEFTEVKATHWGWTVRSGVSQEHAIKLAVEARQAWQREV